MVCVQRLTNIYESSTHNVGKPIYPCLKQKTTYLCHIKRQVEATYSKKYIYFKSYSQGNKALYT